MNSACNNPLFSSSFLHQPLKSSRFPNVSIFFPIISNPITSNRCIPIKTTIKGSMESRNPTKGRSTSPRKFKPRYGTSRRSTIKKSLSQEQVNFTKPIPDDPVVGIIGGGMSGLTCALYLEKRGIRSTVFDTGIHGLGGRMGTRVIDHQPLIFDHAAQFFTVTNPKFAELVDDWLERGLVREWKGTIGELEVGGNFVPFPSSPPKYIGVNGMRPLADSLLSQTSLVNVVRPCWVSALEPFNGTWHLSEKGKPCGQFDAIVIAHNGKCANRLLAASGLPLIAKQMKESIPNATGEKVKEAMLEGVEKALGLSKSSLQKPFYTKLQLWGAALPTNTPGIPCIFDPRGRAGICGDWLLGSSLEAAALSGIALADQIADYFEQGGPCSDEFAVGLHDEYKPLEGHDIGQFPGLDTVDQITNVPALTLAT